MTGSLDGCFGQYYNVCICSDFLNHRLAVVMHVIVCNTVRFRSLGTIVIIHLLVSSVGEVNMQGTGHSNPSLYWASPHPLMMLQLAVW